MDTPVNKQRLAELQGVSLPTITRWIQEGCPYVNRGGRGKGYEFDNAAVTKWRLGRESKKIADAKPGESESSAKARKLSAEADLAEMKAEEQRGILVRKDAVVQAQAEENSRAKARLLAIPTRAAPMVVGMTEHEARNLIDEYICEALSELSVMPDEDESDPEQKESVHLHSGRFYEKIAYDVEYICIHQGKFHVTSTPPIEFPRDSAGILFQEPSAPYPLAWSLGALVGQWTS